MLDELPYGSFIEIEGEGAALRPAAALLGLRWEASIDRSYHDLFEGLRGRLRLPPSDLTFSTLANIKVTPSDLGVELADRT